MVDKVYKLQNVMLINGHVFAVLCTCCCYLFFTSSAYDPADYEHLPVSQEIKELFQYITRYVLFFTMPLVSNLSAWL